MGTTDWTADGVEKLIHTEPLIIPRILKLVFFFCFNVVNMTSYNVFTLRSFFRSNDSFLIQYKITKQIITN